MCWGSVAEWDIGPFLMLPHELSCIFQQISNVTSRLHVIVARCCWLLRQAAEVVQDHSREPKFKEIKII
jgi:hypothetical protein